MARPTSVASGPSAGARSAPAAGWPASRLLLWESEMLHNAL
jgi:hypothetical protein